MAFIILSTKFSLFATNILKLCSAIYAQARLHGMNLFFLKQFVACSASTKILPGKHCILHNTVNHAYSFVESNTGAHTQVSKSGEVSDLLKRF